MWENQPTCTDAVIQSVFDDCCRGSLLPDCYTTRRVLDGLSQKSSARPGEGFLVGQRWCRVCHPLPDGHGCLSTVRITMISSAGLIVLRRWLGIRKVVTKDRSADLAIQDSTVGPCRTLGIGTERIILAMAQTTLAFKQRWSIFILSGTATTSCVRFQCLSRVSEAPDAWPGRGRR
jgi:hypothetical protein